MLARFMNPLTLLTVILLVNLTACQKSGHQEREFEISEAQPATALTIGWYLPVRLLDELVGENYTPRVIKEDSMGSIMLFIVKSEGHSLSGDKKGPMKAAYLVVPIDLPEGIKTPDGSGFQEAMSLPMTIIDLSESLGDRFADLGFATYSGQIELNVEMPVSKYVAEASVRTANGLIQIRGMFDDAGEEMEFSPAMFSNKTNTESYFYGEEKCTRYIDGKGSLKTDGSNIIDAMQLGDWPFFLRLDRNLSWSFDFSGDTQANR